jgi:hypothetical protein
MLTPEACKASLQTCMVQMMAQCGGSRPAYHPQLPTSNESVRGALSRALRWLQIRAENERGLTATGPLRDHRPLCLNFDDYLRCCSVPKRKDANFRDLPGVITHADGGCALSFGTQNPTNFIVVVIDCDHSHQDQAH